MSKKNTKLDQIFIDNIRIFYYLGHIMTLTEFIRTECIENGWDLMIL